MQLEFRRFQQADYPEYAAWFVDAGLDRQLGPMDQAWLDAVLGQPESEGVTWAVFRGEELVAVLEIVFGVLDDPPTGITGLAVKPTLRRQGIGMAVLHQLLEQHHRQGLHQHVAYVATHNEAARRCIERIGFVPTSAPNEHGYVEFQLG